MIRFECDYLEGAHPAIMEALIKTNLEQTVGYGEDEYCARARAKILPYLDNDRAQIHFLVGGTQANLTVICAALRPHQGVISARTGHINVHESGAIEATGHKVLALPGCLGKLRAEEIAAYTDGHWADATHEHMVQPGMVYLSHPTEYGTLYTLDELTAIREVCLQRGLLLYVDGARLGYGLAAEGTDVALCDLARLCDAFYIGGTKVGALFGEAVVLTHPELRRDFRYLMKQRGGMLAKGRLLGVQFDCLFTDGLYWKISKHAVSQALRVRDALRAKGVPFLMESPTNQQFPILPDDAIRELEKEFSFSFWEKTDDTHSCVRICASWATKAENVDRLIARLANL